MPPRLPRGTALLGALLTGLLIGACTQPAAAPPSRDIVLTDSSAQSSMKDLQRQVEELTATSTGLSARLMELETAAEEASTTAEEASTTAEEASTTAEDGGGAGWRL